MSVVTMEWMAEAAEKIEGAIEFDRSVLKLHLDLAQPRAPSPGKLGALDVVDGTVAATFAIDRNNSRKSVKLPGIGRLDIDDRNQSRR